MAPQDWDYFALEDVAYRGHQLTVVWDKLGTRYQLGQGLHVLIDGQEVYKSPELKPALIKNAVSAKPIAVQPKDAPVATNFAVNNDGTYYLESRRPIRLGKLARLP